MRKTLYTLATAGYPEAITDLTFPLMAAWANKIGAAFEVMTDRHGYEAWPPAVAKLRVAERAWVHDDEWSIFLDADALVHPDMFDPTVHLGKEVVMFHGLDLSTIRYDADEYFLRAGRFRSPGNWFVVASHWTRDAVWAPPNITPDVAMERIHPTTGELARGITPEHLADDYLVARNCARFGLTIGTLPELCRTHLGMTGHPPWFVHVYGQPVEAKVKALRAQIHAWGFPVAADEARLQELLATEALPAAGS